ncbi:hypothetical protein KEJ37_05720 [Candidatus Bathyarchaeota archaeon]|nr:hypothetical protein [Candidatus Bathyarchaeota archaeon]
MGIRQKLWNWCPKPKRPHLASFTRLALPLYISLLIGGLLLTVGAAIVLFPPLMFGSSFDEGGRVTEVVERILFPGGAIVVYKNPIYETPKWYISIKVHNYITCEEDLSAYVNSRTKALNELLQYLSSKDKVQVTITFHESVEPDHFKNLYLNYLAESDGPNHSAITVKNETSQDLETIIINTPSMGYLEEWLTQPKENLKTVGVNSYEAFLNVDSVKNLAQHPKVLLIDPQECLTVRQLKAKYTSMGFKVTVDRPPILIKTFEPEQTYTTINMDELLTNPSKYDRWRFYLAGKVSNLNDRFFKLSEKLLVCYRYYGADLSERIASENIKNEDYVVVIGTFFKENSTLYADKIEKAKQDQPSILTVEELLASPIKYNGQKMQVFGNVSDLGFIDGPFFKLDGQLLVCYIYNNTNLQSQLSGVENGDPMIVTGTFHHDSITLYAEHIRPSKRMGR